MDDFKDKTGQNFKINHNTTIKDYFDGLAFYQKRYLSEIRKIMIDIIIASSIGLSCYLVISLIMSVTFPLNSAVAYFFLVIEVFMAFIIIGSVKRAKNEKQHYEYSVRTLIDRLIEDGVTINKNKLETEIGLTEACKKYKKEFLAAAAMAAFFLPLVIRSIDIIY